MKKENKIVDISVENPNFYRIVWKSKKNNVSAVGTYTCTEQEAMRSVKELNSLYPDYIHWAEPNPRLN